MHFALLLWLTFAGLLGLGAMQMLWACAIHLPLAIGWDFCISPLDRNGLRDAIARGQELTQQIELLEVTIVDRPDCPPPPPTQTTQAIPRPTENDRDSKNDRKIDEIEEIEKRVEEGGGKTGSLQISLSWDTVEDLDLYVTCPDGQLIWYEVHEGCGGLLDIDANGSNNPLTNTPVENVVWSAEPPPGNYNVSLIYQQDHGRRAGPVPFKLLLKIGDQQPQVISGTIRNKRGMRMNVHDFSIP